MSELVGRDRPSGLREVTLLMCVLNVAGLFLLQLEGFSASMFYVTGGIAVVISFVVLWYFWNGRNWARWLVLAYSVLSLVNLLRLGRVPLAERIFFLAEAGLGIWLLFWLNQPSARAFFRSHGESGAT